ncbi:MAG: putative bifunctional diguanylate cyclase/phosphodiesterase, partial [Myxococcota bacterium]
MTHVVETGVPDRLVDADERRRARIVLSFTLVLILLGVEAVVFFTWSLRDDLALLVTGALLAALGLVLGVPAALRRDRAALAANLVIGGSFLVIGTSILVVGGVRAPVLHWLALLPMLAVLMGARRSAWLWVGVAIASVSGLVALDGFGIRLPDQLGANRLQGGLLWVQRYVDVGSWVGILFAVAMVYEAQKKRQTRELAEKNTQLELEVAHRSRAEERNQYLAYYDDLTALPNRRLFQAQLRTAMEQAPRLDRQVAVLFLDLDGFKEVNDTHGHAQGDRLLQRVAERLTSCIRVSDVAARASHGDPHVVSRLGGDEFTILLTCIRDHREAALVAQRILACLGPAFPLGNCEVFITASIGIAVHTARTRGVEDLLRNADLAMYHAKECGKNNFQFFDDSMNTDLVRHSTLANDLRRALDRGELRLHFQPIVAADDRRIVAVETLARWTHPEEGPIPPGEFIRVAEESGQMVALGAWIFREACRQYARWRDAELAPPRIAVNVSGLQLRRGALAKTVLSQLREFDLEPECLELEVTEGAMLVDEDEASRCLEEMKNLGVRVAIDDFGTGYSSLSYVKRFPVDALKIDRSFVRDV